jgi:hypothetical protein
MLLILGVVLVISVCVYIILGLIYDDEPSETLNWVDFHREDEEC